MMPPYVQREVEWLSKTIRDACGTVTVKAREWESLPTDTAGANLVAADCGLKIEDNAGWVTYSVDEARRMLTSLLRRDLVFGEELMDLESANFVVRRFFSLVPEGATFFGNRDAPTDPEKRLLGSWTPLTRSTFDSGIIATTQTFSLIVWVEAED